LNVSVARTGSALDVYSPGALSANEFVDQPSDEDAHHGA
jgi:hypothetical protein